MAKKISRTVLFHFLFSGLTFTFLVTLAISFDPYFLHSCANNIGNYTANSDYERNLNTIFKQITSITKSNYGFYSKKVGEVNAMALCRADVKLDVCTGCLKETISRVKLDCPNNKEAIGWSENCTLRYSNTNLSEKLEINPQLCLLNIQSTANEYFQLILGQLLSDLRNKAAAGGALLKYAAGNLSLSASETLYALVQCTPDLSEGDCNHCLDKAATDGIRQCCLKQRGCRVLSPSCNLRFETDPFFEAGAEFPPPPLPSVDRQKEEEEKQNKSNQIPVLVASLSAIFGLAVVFISGFFIWRRRNSRDEENSQEVQLLDLVNEHSRETFNGENGERSQEFPSIQLDVLHAATNHFSDENKLGQGGFGPVYKGTLADGKEIAVKRLSETSSQGLVEFKNEIMLIAKLQHRNLVRLLGCCLEKNEKLLVYEFMPNKSLDVFLFDSKLAAQLDWQKRFNIIKGIARGILYLHEDSRLKIIHRDLKVSNVLLDNEMNPKISDFGMARIFEDKNEANTNRVVGTYGYMAPEYAMEGLFSIKSVFFGVLLLEIVSGKKNNGFHHLEHGESLLTFAWKLWSKGEGMELIDQVLVPSCVASEVLKCIHIGLLCVEEDPADRPTMSSVIFMLASNSTITLLCPSEPAFSVGRAIAKPTEPISDDGVFSVNEVTISNFSAR
ncbi:hypothetical protein ERO13_D10G016201v2 [Gossypium hirsutum]|nr:hypothetical protein ERO13_D10G016201v2 [Gossypium hirsutum]